MCTFRCKYKIYPFTAFPTNNLSKALLSLHFIPVSKLKQSSILNKRGLYISTQWRNMRNFNAFVGEHGNVISDLIVLKAFSHPCKLVRRSLILLFIRSSSINNERRIYFLSTEGFIQFKKIMKRIIIGQTFNVNQKQQRKNIFFFSLFFDLLRKHTILNFQVQIFHIYYQMKNALLIFIGIAIIQSTSEYSFQGNWILELDESSQEINHGRQIIFDFQKKIENGNIINHLTIYACNVMQFVYKIDQKDIAFQFRAELGNTKNCDTNKISDLRRKLEKIFYHVIIAEKLFFLTPDGQPLLKLIKLKENDERKDFSGEWNAFQVAEQHSTVIFTANGTQLELCDGKGLIGYEKKSKGQVKFSMLKTKQCAYHEFFTAVFRSRYYSQKKDEIYFYNQKYDLIMKWKYIGPYKSDILLLSETIYQEEEEEQVLQNTDEKKSILSDFSKSDEKINMEKILTKWFPIESSFEQYFLILMNTRLVLYGGCNVYYSFFLADTSTPGQVELKNYSVSRSDRQCGNEDKIIAEKFSSIAYLEPLYNDDKILLNFLDSSYKTLFTASSIK